MFTRREAVTTGVFFATVFLGKDPNAREYFVTSPGELNITTFNELQMAGTFTFAAASSDNLQVVVQGRFDYRKPKPEVLD